MMRTSLTSRALVRSLVQQQTRSASTARALSNPELAQITKRWETMPPQEQADLWMSLRDRMKVDWKELSLAEKQAAYHVAFGDHGPRTKTPPGEGIKVLGYTLIGVAVSGALFAAIRMGARGTPNTMNKEYQEVTTEYLQGMNVEPISGVSSEGYEGPGMVQSPPKKK